ncbi:uncharacterized protein LOC129924306 [Biomphalaria glabrata]|uniref:Uncharacterized protein LOC129924306 n=1 Tax=Biomphalaria glabrata TaxID=6526 RepID=A0A9W2ZHY5_BIOGL|nr:uncharacterized protein LOC129924306 [Biomphalaria glabrata]
MIAAFPTSQENLLRDQRRVLTASELDYLESETIPTLPSMAQHLNMSMDNTMSRLLQRTVHNMTLLLSAADMLVHTKVLNQIQFNALITEAENVKTILSNLRTAVKERLSSEEWALDLALSLADSELHDSLEAELQEADIPTDRKGTNMVELLIVRQFKEQMSPLISMLVNYL